MCGRYRLSRRKQLVEEYFDTAFEELEWTPRYNIAPTQPVPVIRQNPKEPRRKLSLMRWGLIPSWIPLANSQMVHWPSRAKAEVHHVSRHYEIRHALGLCTKHLLARSICSGSLTTGMKFHPLRRALDPGSFPVTRSCIPVRTTTREERQFSWVLFARSVGLRRSRYRGLPGCI